MNAQLQTIPLPQAEPTQSEPQPQSQLNIPRWSPTLKIAFRFWIVYLGLYSLGTQIVTSLFSPTEGSVLPDPATLWPMRSVISWTGAHILHVNTPLSAFWAGNSATSDDIFAWVMSFCLLVIAAAATVVWSLLDRNRENYAELYKWFRLFARFGIAGQMFFYGWSKVFLVQMHYPSLTRLLQPLGTFSPLALLWNSIGAAPGYQIFCGFAEVAGGLLLLFPRTTVLGALISIADMVQVLVLDLSYDVPVRLLAFNLILLSCFVLAADFPRLVRFLFLNRATAPSTQVRLFRGIRANRIAFAAQMIFGLWLIGVNFHQFRIYWNNQGPGRPIPPLYGIWEVKQMSVDEQPRQPLFTDTTRWRRAIFDYPNRSCAGQYTQVIRTQASTCMAFQRLDDSLAPYGASVNLSDRTIVLTKSGEKDSSANFTFQKPAEDKLILDGRMDNHQVHLELQLADRNKFPLVSRGFRWVMEAPYGRN